jgi:hypothetical protein
MQEFRAMRRVALATRNDAIAAARDQYDQRLRDIGHLEASQNGARRHAGHGVMLQALPRGEFTYRDFISTLERLHPAKTWERRPVNLFLSRACRLGAIQRVSKGVYVRVDGAQPTLADAVAAILTRPMTATEICVTLLVFCLS